MFLPGVCLSIYRRSVTLSYKTQTRAVSKVSTEGKCQWFVEMEKSSCQALDSDSELLSMQCSFGRLVLTEEKLVPVIVLMPRGDKVIADFLDVKETTTQNTLNVF